MFRQLFILSNIRINITKTIRLHYPDSRIIYWDDNILDEEAIKHAVKFTEIAIVEDRLYHAINWGRPIILLSEYSPWLASKLSKTTSDIQSINTINEKEAQLLRHHRPIVFCPSNDTHVMMFVPIFRAIQTSKFLLFDVQPGERAEVLLNTAGIPFEHGNLNKLIRMRPSVIVVGNDWNKRNKELLEYARLLRVPTVCIQEGCLDFDTNQRMQQCTYPFLQGPLMIKHLDRVSYFLTGNPRFDDLNPLPLPKKPIIMVNCNFTYNIHEDKREGWIRDVAEACKTVGVEFFISQHPRDTGNFPDLPIQKSSADVVHKQLEESGALITRFSTTVYEAMLMGRQVIYYNPHRESMRLFNEDETGGIYKAYNQAELIHAIRLVINPITDVQLQKFHQFLELHCGTDDGKSANRCASALRLISKCGYPLPISEPIKYIKSRIERKLRYLLTSK